MPVTTNKQCKILLSESCLLLVVVSRHHSPPPLMFLAGAPAPGMMIDGAGFEDLVISGQLTQTDMLSKRTRWLPERLA
jgi:hypothetical protein